MIVQTESLWKKYGRFEALRGLSLGVPDGGVLSLIGANGAGKTTTLKVLMNLTEPTAGKATLLGIDSRKLSPKELARVGYVSENQRMPGRMTVAEYMAYLRPFYPEWDPVLAEDLLRQMHLPPDRKIGDLSHGMRIKMALACALPFRPVLLVMDEPFSGLDPLARDELIHGLKLRSAETTVLMSSHELTEVDDLTTDVAFLDRGKLLFQQPKSDLLARVKRVLVTLDRPLMSIPQLPAAWLDARIDGSVVTFVDTQFHAQDSPGRIRSLFDGVSQIDTQPIELRAIYTTMARAVRDPRGDS